MKMNLRKLKMFLQMKSWYLFKDELPVSKHLIYVGEMRGRALNSVIKDLWANLNFREFINVNSTHKGGKSILQMKVLSAWPQQLLRGRKSIVAELSLELFSNWLRHVKYFH